MKARNEYSLCHTEIKNHADGTHINIRNHEGVSIGEINAIKKRKVDSLELKCAIKALMRSNDMFEDLTRRVSNELHYMMDALEVRFIF